MADITKCVGTDCPLKEKCYRYKAEDSYWQSYSDFTVYFGNNGKIECEYFLPLCKYDFNCDFSNWDENTSTEIETESYLSIQRVIDNLKSL